MEPYEPAGASLQQVSSQLSDRQLSKRHLSDSQLSDEQPLNSKQLRCYAMDLLARREHSRRELQTKLTRRYPDAFDLIEEVLQGLCSDNLQSDQRFTEAYIAMRKRKGYGPGRIRKELQDKGVERDLIATELGRPEHDWYAQAYDVWRKKFQGARGAAVHRAESLRAGAESSSAGPPMDDFGAAEHDSFKAAIKLKAKQVRFLQYRGFSQDQIQAALDDG
ncbi:regulatory protein RecX [Pseudomaricurvus alcaniphilus]|nr:regulatory protein RecX [Pseudomaricurvus alcaniphilus]